MTDQDLLTLAEQVGLAVHWRDYLNREQRVDNDVLRAILHAMQLPAETAAQQQSSLAWIREERSHIPPLLVRRCDAPLQLPMELCRHLDLERHPPAVMLENGQTLPLSASLQHDGSYHLSALNLSPLNTPGYHQLLVGRHAIPLALAPARACSVADLTGRDRAWGVAAQLYSLRDRDDGGIGHFTALAKLANICAAQGADALAISPLHAQFSADVDHYSPYSPSSRLFLNVLHMDLAADFGTTQLHRWLTELGIEQQWRELESQPLIHWQQSARLKIALARAAWRQFGPTLHGHSELGLDFQRFQREGGETLLDHIRFEALHAEQFRQGRWHWRDWPQELRDPRGEAVQRFSAAHQDEVDFHCFLQWQAHRGLAAVQAGAKRHGMGIGLVTDLAVGTDSGGSHAWSRQQDMLMGLSVGAPPDMLSSKGQNWGLTTFSPHALTLHGYRPFLELLRATLSCAGGMRIDHILGIYRLWLIPDGADPAEGAYVHYPFEDLLNLILLESARHRCIVIGEDLGTIPQDFREPMARAGILGTRVLWFEREHGLFTHPSGWERPVMATTTTHDLPTVAGWWQGRDLDWRVKLELLGDDQSAAGEHHQRAGERRALWEACRYAQLVDGPQPADDDAAPVVQAALSFVAKTPAELALFPVEDILAISEQPNLPGTLREHPNWRRRLPLPISALPDDPAVLARLQTVAAIRNPADDTGP